jgi:deazaflavin-dependent oxidoreductase (nitroreductase family)
MRTCIRRVISGVLLTGAAVILFRAVRRPFGGFRNVVHRFNKYVLNPFALWLVARWPTYYAVIHHVGRRSGRTYATPVVVKFTAEGVIVPLPYGVDTDWYRNLRAAGGATMTLKGIDYKLTDPVVVDATVVGALVPRATAQIWRWFGIRDYLRLKVGQSADARVAAGRVRVHGSQT